MAATVESLTVAIADQASGPADRMANAMAGAADAADKLAASVETSDEKITRSTRSWQSWAASGVDPAATSAKRIEANQRAAALATQALTDDLNKGKISAAQFAEGQLNIAAALAQRNAAVDAAQAKTEKFRGSLDSLTPSSSAAAAALKGGQMALRDLALQSQDFIVQVASGGGFFRPLLQQGSQVAQQLQASGQGFGALKSAASIALGAITSPMGLLVTGTAAATGAVIALGAAAESQSVRLGNLRQQLRATHDDYVTLADAADTAAKRVAASSYVSTSDSRAGAQIIASAKYFSGTSDDIERLTKMSADLAKEWNVDLSAAAARVKDALNDPAAAAKKFADEGIPAFSGLNSGIVEVTASLERQGKVIEAQNVVLTALHQTSAGATQDQSAMSKALHDLEQRFYGARDGGKSLADQMGSLVDKFAAHELHGLDVFIEGLEKMATKASAAAEAISGLATSRGGLVSSDGMPLNLGTSSPNLATSSSSASAQTVPAALTSASTTKDAFVAEWMDAAKQAGSQLGVSPNVLLAQWGLETGWGKSVYDNNAGNIKPGAGYTGQTYVNPGDNQAYRAYPDPKTFADDFVAVVQQKWPDVRNTGANATAYAAGLHAGQQGGYAEDPNYAAKLTGTATTIGVTADQRRLADQLPSDVAGTRAVSSLGNADDLDRLHAQMAIVNQQLNDFAANGDLTSTAFKQAQAQGYGLLQREQELLAAERNRLDPQQQFLRGMQDQVAANAGLTEGDQRVLQLRQQMAQVERDQGGSFSPEQRAQAEAALSAVQQQALARQIDGMRTATAGQDNLAAAYDQGYDAVAKTTAATAGYTASLAYGARGSDQQRAAAASLTTEYQRQADAASKLAVAQATRQNNDQVKYLDAETQSLGMNDNARTAYLAHLQAEQFLVGKNIELTSDYGQAYLASVDKISAASAAYKGQEASLNELRGFVDSTFSTISDAIVSAFATGQQEAVKFKDVAASVVKAIEAEFLKLALINPLKNWLLGDDGKSPTLTSVGGIIGKLLGNEGTGITGSFTNSTAGGLSTLFDGGGTTLSAASATSSGSGGFGDPVSVVGTLGTGAQLASNLTGGSAGGLVAGLADKITDAVTSALGNSTEAINIAADAGNLSNSGIVAASVSNALGFSNDTAAAISSAAGTVADALPYIGAAISVVTSLISGDYKSAAFTLAGAAIGTAILPGIGTAVGAALGSLVTTIFPSHPLHPYSNVDLNIAGGQLTTANGYDVGQLTDLNADKAGVQAYADSINTYLQKVGVVITDADGTLGHIGAGITGFNRGGLTTGQTTDPSTLFKNLSFGGDPNDQSNFGIAKGALTGMSFNAPIDLQNELYKIAGFADAVDALGINLRSVGKDISNIQIASVADANPDATSTVQDSTGRQISYHADLRTALNADLPTQTYADTTALDAEMQKVSDFVTGTIPSLLTPVRSTQSTLQDQIQASNQKYAEAMAQSRSYGLNNDAPLSEARDQAIAILMKPALDALNTSITSIVGRGQTLLYGQAGSGAATMANLAQTQNNEQSSLYDSIHQTFGDNAAATTAYNNALQQLLVTQNAETQATQQQVAIAQAQGLAGLLATEATNASAAGIDGLGASLRAFDAKAADQRLEFIKSWTDYYGQAAIGSQDLQDQLLIMDKASAAQRLQVQQTYSDASVAALKTAQGSVASLFTSIHDYVLKLETGSQSALSPTAQYDLTKSQFNAVSGAALAGDANSASQLTTYADALLTASQAYNGSGAAFAADEKNVLDVLQGVVSNPDGLTQSFMAQQIQQQTDAIVTAQNNTLAEISALRREVQNLTRVMAA